MAPRRLMVAAAVDEQVEVELSCRAVRHGWVRSVPRETGVYPESRGAETVGVATGMG